MNTERMINITVVLAIGSVLFVFGSLTFIAPFTIVGKVCMIILIAVMIILIIMAAQTSKRIVKYEKRNRKL